MPAVQVNAALTLTLAAFALVAGSFLCRKIRFLRAFCIPSPVIGGLAVAILTCILHETGTVYFDFDTSFGSLCMLVFFTSVGFKIDLKEIKRGGKAFFILLGCSTLLIVIQNGISIGMSNLMNLSPLIGLCTGSIPLIGGHGTSAAFGPMLEELGVKGASTLCIASATFGILAGSLIGCPIGNRLIKRYGLLETAVPETEENGLPKKADGSEKKAFFGPLANSVLELAVACGVGTLISALLEKTGLTFPDYIGAMIAAAIIRNVNEGTHWFPTYPKEISDIGNVSLMLFLGVAMITLELWALTGLAVQILAILLVQTVLLAVFARYIVFPLLGRDYDSAVIVAGMCGYGLGATPNAMANMKTLTDRYVPSAKAFILVPLVGSMFLDFINSILIIFAVNLVV